MSWVILILFIFVSISMILIILVQRPQGGGLAGAFGGAGGGSTDTVFGGRVGDALTAMTVVAFCLYLALAIGLNMLDNSSSDVVATPAVATQPDTGIPSMPVSEADPSGSVQTITIPVNANSSPGNAINVTPMTPTGTEVVPPSTSPAGGGGGTP